MVRPDGAALLRAGSRRWPLAGRMWAWFFFRVVVAGGGSTVSCHGPVIGPALRQGRPFYFGENCAAGTGEGAPVASYLMMSSRSLSFPGLLLPVSLAIMLGLVVVWLACEVRALRVEIQGVADAVRAEERATKAAESEALKLRRELLAGFARLERETAAPLAPARAEASSMPPAVLRPTPVPMVGALPSGAAQRPMMTKQPPQVLINGQELIVDGRRVDVEDLQALPPSRIERLEILPTKAAGAGEAGTVNVVLRNDAKGGGKP